MICEHVLAASVFSAGGLFPNFVTGNSNRCIFHDACFSRFDKCSNIVYNTRITTCGSQTQAKVAQKRRGNVKMPFINNYQKGWALRYIREAKAELSAAQKTPYMAPGLILEALRKAQAAIYYSLGDPPSIEAIVRDAVFKRQLVKDHVLHTLVEIERTVQEVAQIPESDVEKAMKRADDIVKVATDIVQLFTGEKLD